MSKTIRNSTLRGKDRKTILRERNCLIKNQLRSLVIQVLNEEDNSSNPVIRNVTAKEKFDDFIIKPENRGLPFSREELDILGSLESKPYKKSATEIRFSKTDETNNTNKELVVVKKQNHYVAYFSAMKPVDVSADQSIESQEIKDNIFIKISRPFSSPTQDAPLLSNFIDVITKEYQI